MCLYTHGYLLGSSDNLRHIASHNVSYATKVKLILRILILFEQ